MKKIPTLFQREFEGHQVTGITLEFTSPELEEVLKEGTPTVKYDGACCAILDGTFYKRYDAKKNKRGQLKTPPEGAIPCGTPDPVTGHWPHWVKVRDTDPADRWFMEAYRLTLADGEPLEDGTYEAVGPHFQGNPHQLQLDILIPHGKKIVELPDRSFEGIREYLRKEVIEGIVFWKDGEPRCKIKRSDFGFPWPDGGEGI